ncbi:hypothetical protein [Streptomyces sp. Ncost-T10-10d]|uniref:hypothetical protein n=1 Tax=Streptomyces sp. Ncost-T10-10d TaxID=1839774 RepID=UPI00114C8F7D|nr:hypothetical protein [Streptomyces sp. Ncost-T10-10d]
MRFSIKSWSDGTGTVTGRCPEVRLGDEAGHMLSHHQHSFDCSDRLTFMALDRESIFNLGLTSINALSEAIR